jgi:hypothetical protein
MSRRTVPRIFCVEGGWSPRLTARESVRPLLEYMEKIGQIRFIHERANSVDNALDLFRKWPQAQYRQYSLGYFGFHGSPGQLHIGRRRLGLDALADELDGAARGKTLYFGSCSVLDLPKREIEVFRARTGARCVAGYATDVEWFESSAFDLLLFEALTHYKRIDAVDRWLQREYRPFARRLNFRMVY